MVSVIATRVSLLYRGLLPLYHESNRQSSDEWYHDVDSRIKSAIEFSRRSGFIEIDTAVVWVSEWRIGAGANNTMRIAYVE